MGLLSRARALDNRVLGTPDSKRGYFANLFLGLNPYLYWVYVAVIAISAVRIAAAIATGADWSSPLVSLIASAALAYASKDQPKRWRREDS